MNETKKDSISIIVLAAGLSTRFGRNKMLEQVGNRTMVENVVAESLMSKAEHVIVVIGHEKEKVRKKLERYGCEFIWNEDYKRGQSTSVKKGLSGIDRDTRAVIVLPGDIAMVDHKIINAVIDEYLRSNSPIVAAAFRGHQGHPILFDIKLLDEMKSIDEDTQGLRRVVSDHKSEVRKVETSEGALIDVDWKADMTKLL